MTPPLRESSPSGHHRGDRLVEDLFERGVGAELELVLEEAREGAHALAQRLGLRRRPRRGERAAVAIIARDRKK